MGCIIGDIVGSTREGYGKNVVSERFELIPSHSYTTDDTAMNIALAEWLLHRKSMSLGDVMKKWYQKD